MRFSEFKINEEADSIPVQLFKTLRDIPKSLQGVSDGAGAGPSNTVAHVSGNYPALKEPGFKEALEKTAGNLGVNPDHLIAIMKQESGLDPQARNPSGATGLIQFMPKTAIGLGTTTSALYKMSAVEQLPWVEKYFRQTKIRPGASLGDLYMAVFYPAYVGQPDDKVISSTGKAVYNQNKGLDRNKDGVITVGDVKQSVARYA